MEEYVLKATGIVRRIDDLGRIVIPKEIRRTLKFREADPIEIFIGEDGEIVLKKYSAVGELVEFASSYADSLAQTTGHLVCVTDRDKVIAASGGDKKRFIGKSISKGLENTIQDRGHMVARSGDGAFVGVTSEPGGDCAGYEWQAVSTIVCAGDAIGAVVIMEKNTEEKIARLAANFLGRQTEI
jgi:AbrB family transcriptional regulator (stage V sporulation protein T)